MYEASSEPRNNTTPATPPETTTLLDISQGGYGVRAEPEAGRRPSRERDQTGRTAKTQVRQSVPEALEDFTFHWLSKKTRPAEADWSAPGSAVAPE